MLKDQLLTSVLSSAFGNMVSIGTGLILILASQSMQAGAGNLTVGDFALFVYLKKGTVEAQGKFLDLPENLFWDSSSS